MTEKVKRLRLNNDIRKNALGVIKDFYESKNSKQRIAMKNAIEVFDELTPQAHEKVVGIVRKYQPQEDVDTMTRMISKYNSSGGTMSKDACFYLGREVQTTDYEGNPKVELENIHYDFNLYGTVHGHSGSDFAYAYYRDELKANGYNPDINAEMIGKDRNPHLTKHSDRNDEYLGFNRRSDNGTFTSNHSNEWSGKYQIDVIGRSYCGSRQFKVSQEEHESLQEWSIAKSNVVKTHHAYVDWLKAKVDKIEAGLKTYKYYDEIQKLCDKIGCPINESQLHGESSMALSIYSPDNLASMLEDDDDGDDIKAQMIASFKAQRQSVN